MRTPWSAALLCAFPLVLAGCSGSPSSSAGAAGTAFTIATDAVTTTLEPSKYDNISHRFAHDPVKATLLQYQSFDETNGQVPGPDDLKPALATDYRVADDGITLQLGEARSAAGNTLSADDVVYTFDRILGLEDPIALSLMTNAGIDPKNPVTVLGEHEVKINAKVNALSAQTLDSYRFSVLDSEAVQAHATDADPWATDWLSANTASYGPYQVSAFTPGTSITLKANPNYDGEIAYPTVNVQAVADPAARVVMAKTGQAQMVSGLPLSTISTLAKDQNVQVLDMPSQAQDMLELNKDVKAFQDPVVRRAISQAVDRAALLAGPYSGLGTVSTSLVSTKIPAQNSTSEYFEHDAAAARQALAEAGYSDLSFTITTNQASISPVPAESLLTALKQQLAAAGISVEVATVASAADFTAAYHEGKYEAFIRLEAPLVADPVFFLNAFHSTGGLSNYMKDSDAGVDAAVKEALNLTGEDRLAAIAPGIRSANDNMIDIPLVESSNQYVYPASVCPGPMSIARYFDPATAAPC
ncbi:ABC transporter substrate-binding protein [Kineosporia babensis]|uniref:ABC transporter substrate-binding protein n=1 Tax=Kineosporia babensis TaxID=499548 RepID=A0A9X1NI26_9ACTN|nr:ABC transporter substrate-binding protein [Kineosporia babensis]MCD5314450.1 ABC transporter substrate-binding protein [Kineosporia babensis]